MIPGNQFNRFKQMKRCSTRARMIGNALGGSCLLLAAMALAAPVYAADLSAPSVAMNQPSDESAAKERYTMLMEQAEGAGRHCMISETGKEETIESARNFFGAAKFGDIDPGKPIQVTLPEGWYSPQGRIITFDSFAIVVDQKHPSRYISMTKTDKGLLLEPKISIALKDGKIFCIRNLSATMGFRTAAPAGAQEQPNSSQPTH